MRTLALIFFFIAVPVASGNWQPTDDASFWRETGVDAKYAAAFLNNDLCYTDELLFKSCVEAFLQGGSSLKTLEFENLMAAKFGGTNRVDFDGLLKRVDALAGTAKFPREMILGDMINAQIRQFDGHAVIAPADRLNQRMGSASEDITGIGVDEVISAAGVHIRRVYPNTPAETAKLMPNDRLVSMNGKLVGAGLKAVGSLRALAKKPGTVVRLEIERAGAIFPVDVVIGFTNLRNVTVGHLPLTKNENVAIVHIRQFSEGVCDEVERRLGFGNVSAAILDMRGNPGGRLDEAACVMSLFTGPTDLVFKKPVDRLLPAKIPLVTEYTAEQQELWRLKMREKAVFPKIRLAVLVDAASASASEMLAAALQDQKRAWVIGEPTFGKGSTQAVIGEASNSKLRLIYTVSRYYRAGGLPLQLIGMRPNFIVPVVKSATDAERLIPREGEFYGTLLGKEKAEAWTDPREALKTKILKRMARGARADHLNAWLTKQQGFEDFQKAYALAVLGETKDLKEGSPIDEAVQTP